MQKTILVPPHPNELLANAVLHLANALDNPCGIAGVGPSCEAARDLVRDLAAPEHSEDDRSASRGPFIHVRETRTTPDGSLEVRERLSSGVPSPAPLHSDRVTLVDAPPPDVLNSMLANMRPAGPVVTARLVDGRMTVFHDGVHAPDSPWQQAFDAQQHQADRVMVRAVAPGHAGHDDELVEWDEWVLDPDAAGHRAPFSAGDLVMYSNGREGLHRVVAVSVNKDLPRHRSLRLRVKPTDVVIDSDAF